MQLSKVLHFLRFHDDFSGHVCFQNLSQVFFIAFSIFFKEINVFLKTEHK